MARTPFKAVKPKLMGDEDETKLKRHNPPTPSANRKPYAYKKPTLMGDEDELKAKRHNPPMP